MSAKSPKARPVAVELSAALQKLAGKPVLFYDLGPVSSPFVDLHFGRKVEREEPLEYAPQGSELARFEGELSLFVSCAWRIETPDEVVCGCWDDKGPDGQMRAGLDRLVGRTVRRVLAGPPAWDLSVELDGGLLLRLFCDQTNDEEGADNYSLFTRDRIFTVGTLSDLFVEPRTADE